MASKITLTIGPLSGDASLGAATDQVIGAKIKAWAIGMGVVDADATNQQVADAVAAYLRSRLRNAVRNWYIAGARTTFEQTSQASGDAYLDED